MRIDEVVTVNTSASFPAKRFIEELQSQYPENPENPQELVVPIPGGYALLNLTASTPRTVHISHMHTQPRRLGIGSSVIRLLQNLATERRVNLSLDLGKDGEISYDDLRNFYKRLGFRSPPTGFVDLYWEPEQEELKEERDYYGSRGAGCLIFAQSTGRFCLAHRSSYVYDPDTWGIVGGRVEPGEKPQTTALRELREETGYNGPVKLELLWTYRDGDRFEYSNYLAVVDQEFEAQVNWETQEFRWVEYGDWPAPLHFGLAALLKQPRVEQTLQKLSKQGQKNA